jgi:uncharacterized protein (UPF0332 family)
MSLKKKLEWCMKKGESEERKHKGLRKVEPDNEKSKKYIEKAEHNIEFAGTVRKLKKFNDWIFPIAFYAVYHSCLAVLIYFGYESRNQECTFIMLEHLIKEGKINLSPGDINKLRKISKDIKEEDMKTLREDFQYGIETGAKEELANNAVKTAKEFVERVKGTLYVLSGEV